MKGKMTIPDLVYPVKFFDDGDELRYSLRSVATNAQGLYRNIWIVTEEQPPDWLVNVNILPAGSGNGIRADDVRAKYVAVCDNPEVSDEIVILHDDFFLVEKIDKWETFHSGTTSEYLQKVRNIQRVRQLKIAGDQWTKAVTDTANWMESRGHGDILAYQGHRPYLWDKELLGETLAEYPKDKSMDINGLYPIAGIGGVGTKGMNSKIKDTDTFHEKVNGRDIPWLSSSDLAFKNGLIGGYIRGMFREPSPYERS